MIDSSAVRVAAVVSLAVLLLVSFVAVMLAGCDGVTIGPGPSDCSLDPDCPLRRPINEQPPIRADVSVDVPRELRERNYAGGSCVHASLETTLRHQGRYDLADWWRRNYSGGEYAEGLEAKMEQAGLRWASTNSGDPEFLEWVSRTRRTAVIFYKPAHAINFIVYENREGVVYAKLLDNNRPDVYEYVEQQEFIRRWQGYGGFAATIVGTPPPPDQLWRGGRPK